MAIRNVTRAGVGLAVGIIVVALLVLGGLLIVRERGEQARREEAIAIADQQLKDESNQEIAIDSNEEANKDAESTNGSQAGTAGSGAAANQSAGAAVTELPQTGPKEASIFAFAILAFAVASFIHSRKLLTNER